MSHFNAWHLAALDDNGYGDTSIALMNRVADYLKKHCGDEIGNEEFVEACLACHVDPYSVTQQDLDYLQRRLNNSDR